MRGPGFVSSHQLFLFVKKKNWMKNHCCYQSFLWSKMLIAQTDFLRCPIEPWVIDGIEVSGRSKVDWHMAILSVRVTIKLFLPFRSSPFSVVEAWTQNGRRTELLRFIFFALAFSSSSSSSRALGIGKGVGGGWEGVGWEEHPPRCLNMCACVWKWQRVSVVVWRLVGVKTVMS